MSRNTETWTWLVMTPNITPQCGIVLPHTSTSRSIKFRHTVLNVHATSCHCIAWGQGIPSHPWISFSSLTASHQIKHWECTLPSLTSWIPVTALTYFKLECGLSSPVSSQNVKRQFCLKLTCHMTFVSLPHLSTSFLEFVCWHEEQDWWPDQAAQTVCTNPRRGTCTGWQHLRVAPAHVSARELPASSQHPSHWMPAPCCSPKASPVFCILHVFVNWVSGGMDSPSPMVTSSTNDMEGTLIFGLSKS